MQASLYTRGKENMMHTRLYKIIVEVSSPSLPPSHTQPRTGGTAMPRIRERIPTGFEISRTTSRASKVRQDNQSCHVQWYEREMTCSFLQTPAGDNNRQSLPTVSSARFLVKSSSKIVFHLHTCFPMHTHTVSPPSLLHPHHSHHHSC